MPLKEKSLIERLRLQAQAAARSGGGVRGLIAGIGDDCAVLQVPRGHEALVTTDFSLEGIHFRRDWHSAEVVGHRCLTRGLSDIAAMGGEPIAVFLSLALPSKLPQKWVDDFLRGFLKLARRFGVPLGGGDTAQSPAGILADIVVVGSVPRGAAVLRSGAKPGDGIYVSGELGASAATIQMLRGGRQRVSPADFPAHFSPLPRIALGRVLRQTKIASAMIDISDGLSTDLAHICEESGVGAEIQAQRIPLGRNGRPARRVDLRFALHGGDDYELLFTARPQISVPQRMAGVAITQIGRITRSKRVVLISGGHSRRLTPEGWEHFAR